MGEALVPAQKRHLTILFSDLSRSTALAHELGPEDMAVLMDRVQQIFQQEISKHGGEVTQVHGDGVYAVFGLAYQEDAGRRAVEAALSLHRTVKALEVPELDLDELPFDLTMHSGIHSGISQVLPGDQAAGNIRVFGDAVNLASKLSNTAGADEILVSEISLGADRHLFQLSDLSQVEIKEFNEQLDVYRAHGQAPLPSRFHSRLERSAPLVGRSEELAWLKKAYERSRLGNVQTLTVVGPPGAGKSRLVEEFLKSLERGEVTVLRGYCEALRNTVPMQPLLHMICQLARIPHDQVSRLVEAEGLTILEKALSSYSEKAVGYAKTLQDFVRSSVTNQTKRAPEVIGVFVQVVTEIASSKPLVLFLDDWQWADDLTRGVLQPLERSQELQLTLLRTSRQEELARTSSDVISLLPLELDDIDTLIGTLLPSANQFSLSQIRSASGGNPLYLEELCHAARQGRALPDDQSSGLEIYNSLHMLIEARVADLDQDCRRILCDMAILGDDIPFWMLASTIPDANLPDVVAKLSELDFVYLSENGAFLKFKHGVTREVVYAITTKNQRLDLHKRAVVAIDRRFDEDVLDGALDRLSYHLSGTRDWGRTAEIAQAAGDRAYFAAALDRARLHYERTFVAWRKLLHREENPEIRHGLLDRWMDILKRYAQACLYDAEVEQLTFFEEVAALAESLEAHRSVLETEYWLAYINYTMGYHKRALRHVDKALVTNQQARWENMESQLAATRGQILVNTADHDAALRSLEDGITRQRRSVSKSGVVHPYAYSLGAQGMALGYRGEFEASEAAYAEAESLVQGSVHQVQASVYTMHAGSLLWQGEWQRALDFGEKGVALAAHLGSDYMLESSSALIGCAKWKLGHDDAQTVFDRAVAFFKKTTEVLWSSLHFSWHADFCLGMGDIEGALDAIEWIRKVSRNGERLGDVSSLCTQATLGLETQARCQAMFSLARETAQQHGSHREMAMVSLKELEWHIKNGEDATRFDPDIEALDAEFTRLRMPVFATRARQIPQLS
ncbi:MAG: AAA family ATPase [Pseudomonadota bacterium]